MTHMKDHTTKNDRSALPGNPAPFVREEKKAQRIGVVSWFDGDHGRRLQQLVERCPAIMDVRKLLPKDRMRVLRTRYGIMPSRQQAFENMTPTAGFNRLVKAMTGNIATVAEIQVNVHALGSDATPATLGDTGLGNETARTLLSSTSYTSNKAYYTAFYGLSEAVGTHEEMGLFIDADEGVPDDGTLWDRTLNTIVKTGIQSLTIDYEDSFTNA